MPRPNQAGSLQEPPHGLMIYDKGNAERAAWGQRGGGGRAHFVRSGMSAPPREFMLRTLKSSQPVPHKAHTHTSRSTHPSRSTHTQAHTDTHSGRGHQKPSATTRGAGRCDLRDIERALTALSVMVSWCAQFASIVSLGDLTRRPECAASLEGLAGRP